MNTYFFREKKEKNYTVIDNTCLQDERLSWKAKGLFCYLLSLPDSWEIYMSEIVRHSTDGETAVKSAVKELEKYGYIQKSQEKDDKGRFTAYTFSIFEKPKKHKKNPPAENPETDKQEL